MNGCRKRIGFVRIIVRKTSLRTERASIARNVQVIDVLDQIRDEEKRVYFVLVFRRFGKLVLLVGATFESGRIVLAEMPRSERRLQEGLFGRQRVVDERVRAGQRSH